MPIDTLPTRHFESLPKGVFTLTETETKTDKMGLNSVTSFTVFVSVSGEHLHTIPYNPFFNGTGLYQCKHTLTIMSSSHCTGTGMAPVRAQ